MPHPHDHLAPVAGLARWSDIMHFDERIVGDYRIFAGAMEAPRGEGFTAAMIVQRLRGIPNAPREAYRDESLAGGHRWESAEAALSYALNKAQDVIHKQARMLAC